MNKNYLMKKTLLIILILSFFNCASSKKNTNKTEQWINNQNFTIKKPNSWRAVINHGYISYTPLKKSKNLSNNVVSVFKFELKEKPNFKKFVKNQIEQTNQSLNITFQEVINKKGKLGETYIHKLESVWDKTKYKSEKVYFTHNDEYYFFNYSSLNQNYKKYYKDAISILNSIEFK